MKTQPRPCQPSDLPKPKRCLRWFECPTPSLWKTLIFIQCRFHINFDLNIIHPDDWIFAKRLKGSVSLALSCPWLWELISIVCDQHTVKDFLIMHLCTSLIVWMENLSKGKWWNNSCPDRDWLSLALSADLQEKTDLQKRRWMRGITVCSKCREQSSFFF